MKLLFTLLLFVPLINWEPSFENAQREAKEQHKLILLNFSGSDWCGPCIVLRKDYLESEVFTRMANENLILVNADFPRKKKNELPVAMVKRNERLAELYNKAGNFPFTLLLDPQGKVLKTWLGKPEVSPEKFTEDLLAICKQNK